MACFSGTKIVNDGLTFHFDLANSVKSWKGKPTTNLATDSPTMNGWAGTYTVVNSATKTFDIQTTQLNAATTSAWRTWYWDVSSYIGQTITISAFVQFVSETNATFYSITIGQGNTGSFPYHITGSDPADRITVTTKPVNRIKMSWTGVINSTGVVGFTQWISNVTANGGNGILKISNVQIEVGSIATKFINGVRLDTASIVDLSPLKSTITASNLTYRQDDTPVFDGTDDELSVLHTAIEHPTTSYTSEAWIWVDPSQSNTYPRIWDKATILVHITQTAPFTIAQNTSTSAGLRQVALGSAIQHSTWTHIATSYDGQVGRIYINGSQVVLNNFGSVVNINSSTSNLGIGGSVSDTSRQFNGKIDQLRIYWNKALSATEIKQNFEATRGRYGI